MKKLILLFTMVFLTGSEVFAQEKLLESRELKFVYYDIGGSTIDEILKQLNSNPLADAWGRTSGNLYGVTDCDVSLKVEVIMPRLVHPETLFDKDRREVVRMIEALKQHEMRHVYIALYYAEELIRDKCPKDHSALKEYWDSKGRELDENTDFGRKDGVHLFGK